MDVISNSVPRMTKHSGCEWHTPEQHQTCSHGAFPDSPLQKLLANPVQDGLPPQSSILEAPQWQWCSSSWIQQGICVSVGTQPDSVTRVFG